MSSVTTTIITTAISTIPTTAISTHHLDPQQHRPSTTTITSGQQDHSTVPELAEEFSWTLIQHGGKNQWEGQEEADMVLGA